MTQSESSYFHSSKRGVCFYWGMCFYLDIHGSCNESVILQTSNKDLLNHLEWPGVNDWAIFSPTLVTIVLRSGGKVVKISTLSVWTLSVLLPTSVGSRTSRGTLLHWVCTLLHLMVYTCASDGVHLEVEVCTRLIWSHLFLWFCKVDNQVPT